MIRRAISRSEDSLPRLKLLGDAMAEFWVPVADGISSGCRNASAVKHNNVNVSGANRFVNRFLGNMLLLQFNKQECEQLTLASY